MKRQVLWLVLTMVALTLAGCCEHPRPARFAFNGLTEIYHVQPICNGITTTSDGRAFVCFPHPDGGGGVSIAEVFRDSSLKPYPDVKWNDWKPSDDAKQQFVRTNSLRIGPDGNLWIVDIGSPGMEAPVVPDGPKLVVIDLKTNHVVRIYHLDDAVKPKSFVDDLRFGDHNIYLTDAGEPGLIVLDPRTFKARRMLENHRSTVSRDMYAEGKLLTKPSGEHVKVHADQLEVSPDGAWLYYQPCSGPMSRIQTKYLDDASLSEKDLETHVQPFYNSPTIGGTAMDAAGNIYLDDVEKQRVTRVTPDGHATTVVEDKQRLHWGDAMWIDDDGYLWIPAAQLNRSSGMSGTLLQVDYPIAIYKIRIYAKPLRR